MTQPLQQQIKIMGQPTPQPNVCKFIVDHPILPGGTINCRTAEMAEGSPLLEALFALEGIEQVMLDNNVLTIDKSNDESWPVLGKQIGAAVREVISSGVPLLSPDLKPGLSHSMYTDEELLEKVRTLLFETINPALAGHGGLVDVVQVKDSDVYLQMGGGCQGCGAASFTMQMSIERTLRTNFPQIQKIIDQTNHSAGENPYYK